jgi:hypothetical protein
VHSSSIPGMGTGLRASLAPRGSRAPSLRCQGKDSQAGSAGDDWGFDSGAGQQCPALGKYWGFSGAPP